MSKVEELERAVASLPAEEYREFRRWFLERDWEQWDQQMEEDAKAGKLDFLVREALEAKQHRLGQPVRGSVRRMMLSRFPYHIDYRLLESEHLRILAVAHNRRRPEYWAGRQ